MTAAFRPLQRASVRAPGTQGVTASGFFEGTADYHRDLLWHAPDMAVTGPIDAVRADFKILVINPTLDSAQRQTELRTPGNWTAHITEVSDPLDGLVRAVDLQCDMLVIDLDTPTFHLAEVLGAIRRSSHFHEQILLAVTTDRPGEEIEGFADWPAGVLLLHRATWLQALALCQA